MKTIIVATDFSRSSLNAVDYAADMAMAIQANLLLLHTYEIPVTYTEIPVAIDAQLLQTEAEKELELVRTRLLKDTQGKLIITSEVRLGSFYEELKSVCQNTKPYAVILGSQGTSSAERFFFGSHTVYAMKHLRWPLIAVPLGVRFLAVKKIGLACDLQNVMETIPVDEIKMLMQDFNAELHILNTDKEEVFDPEIVFQSGLLAEMFGPVRPQYHFISDSDIDQGIIDFTEKNEIDLLIVLPRRHSLLDSIMHRSHTKRMVLHSPVPVMSIHQ